MKSTKEEQGGGYDFDSLRAGSTGYRCLGPIGSCQHLSADTADNIGIIYFPWEMGEKNRKSILQDFHKALRIIERL